MSNDELSPDQRRTAAPTATARARKVAGRPRPTPRPGATDRSSSSAAVSFSKVTTDSVDVDVIDEDLTDEDVTDTEVIDVEETKGSSKRGKARATKAKSGDPDTEQVRVEKTEKVKAEKVKDEGRSAKAPTAASRLLWWVMAGAASVVAIVLVIALIASYLHLNGRDSASVQRQRMVSGAKSAVATITSYDYRHLAEDQAAAVAKTTEPFTSKYTESMLKVIIPEAEKQQSVVSGEVNVAGVETMADDGKSGTVLVYGQLNVTNRVTTTPRLDLFSVLVTVKLVRGKWLVSDLKQV